MPIISTRDMCYLLVWTDKNKQFLTCDTLCNDIIRDTLNCVSAWGNKNDIMLLFLHGLFVTINVSSCGFIQYLMKSDQNFGGGEEEIVMYV